MHVTIAMLENGYELLRATPPFRGWRLPPSELVEFQAIPLTRYAAEYDFVDGTHIIRVCLRRHTHLNSVLMSLAHEMCHMHQKIAVPRDRAHHGAYWHACAKQVCRLHGWDYGVF